MISMQTPDQSRGAALPLFRCRPGSETRLTLLSPEPAWAATHWFGRQLLCPGGECVACDSNLARPVAYLIAAAEVSPKRRQPVLIESGQSALTKLQGLARLDGIELAPGAVLIASRNRSNSPLNLEPTGETSAPSNYYADRRILARAIAALYRIPGIGDNEEMAAYKDRVRSGLNSLLTKAMRTS